MAFVCACAAARKNDALPLPILIGESAQLDRSGAEKLAAGKFFSCSQFFEKGNATCH